MASSSKQVTLAGSVLDCRCHVCAFFDHGQNEQEILLPFMVEGLSSGDSAVQIVDPHDRSERMRMLIESGIDADAAEHDGRLGIIEWEGAYLVHGRFDQQSMLEFAEAIGAGREKTGAVTRIWADMAWAAREIPGVLDLAEYECRLNHILPKYDMAVVCAYDVSKFDSTVMWNVLRAHPQIIIGGKLAKNPFYVLPDALLREFGKQ